MKIFPYNQDRINENKAGKEEITEKQVSYIRKLANIDPGTYEDVLRSIPDWDDKELEDFSKGQGMYIIKCMLGEIKPVGYK